MKQTILYAESEPHTPACYQTKTFNPKLKSCSECPKIQGCATWNFYEKLIQPKRKPIKDFILESPITWMVIGGFSYVGISTLIIKIAEWIF